MVPYSFDAAGGGSAIGLKLEEAFTSGVLFGIAGLLIRRVMLMIRGDIELLTTFISDPLTWFALIVGGLGFAYMQAALYRERISYVVPTVSALSIVTPLVISVVFLNETVQLVRWLGTIFVIIGIIGISQKRREGGLLSSIFR